MVFGIHSAAGRISILLSLGTLEKRMSTESTFALTAEPFNKTNTFINVLY